MELYLQAQLSQLYYAFGVAIALGRTIVLPEVRQMTPATHSASQSAIRNACALDGAAQCSGVPSAPKPMNLFILGRGRLRTSLAGHIHRTAPRRVLFSRQYKSGMPTSQLRCFCQNGVTRALGTCAAEGQDAAQPFSCPLDQVGRCVSRPARDLCGSQRAPSPCSGHTAYVAIPSETSSHAL